MIVKLSTPAREWPWRRQTPGESGRWGPFSFVIDEPVASCDAWVVFESLDENQHTVCPPDRVVFIAGEPPSIGNYNAGFLQQFSHVVTTIRGIEHENVLHLQQGHPWFVEKNFDELISACPPEKVADLCVLVSDKAFTEGHRKRLEFVQLLKERLGNRVSVFGRGVREFASKWDVLARYKYSVVLENDQQPDFLTEKMPDAWLAFSFPFYSGCTNISRYFPPGAFELLDLNAPEKSIENIRSVIDDPSHYEQVLPQIARARQYYLWTYQFFPNMASILQAVLSRSRAAAQEITLRPNRDFAWVPPPPPWHVEVRNSIKSRIKRCALGVSTRFSQQDRE